jgi:hypothetical protein
LNFVPGNCGNTVQKASFARNSFSQRTSICALADDLFGLYPNRREAQRSSAHARRRTPPVSQAARAGRNQAGACAGYRQKNCRGVCIGKETPALHSARLLTALAKFKVKTWPYKGPVVLIERDEFGMREDHHLIDRWRLLGTLHSEEDAAGALADGPSRQRFDPDIYRIIKRFLQAGKLRVRPLPPFSLERSATGLPARPPALRTRSAMSVLSVFSAQSMAVAPRSLARFGSALLLQQHFDDLEMPKTCGKEQRRRTIGGRRIDLGALLQQVVDHCRMAIESGVDQRRPTVEVDVGAGFDEALDERHLPL